MGICHGWDGHGVIHSLRHRPRLPAPSSSTGVPVARIIPGVGVELEGGERIESPCVVSNADPRVTLRLLGNDADPAWRARVEAVPQVGCTVKLNIVLKELPSFTARPGTNMPHHLGQINTPLSKEEWRTNSRAARAGELPERLWTELYFHTRPRSQRRARRACTP